MNSYLHNGTEESADIINFYKRKFDEFSREHQTILNRIDNLRNDHETNYRLNYEISKRKEEIQKLQRILSHSQSLLVDEQKKSFKAISDLDRMKVKEVEDRDYMAQLVDKIKNGKSNSSQFNPFLKPGFGQTTDLSELKNVKKENKHLKLKVLALEAQLEDQKTVYDQMYRTFSEELQVKTEEENYRQEATRNEFYRLQKDIEKHKTITISNLSEMVELRRQAKLLEFREIELEMEYKQKYQKLQSESINSSHEDSQQTLFQGNFGIPGKPSVWDQNRFLKSNVSKNKSFTQKENCNNINHKRIMENIKLREKELSDLKIRFAFEKEEHEKAIQKHEQYINTLKKKFNEKDQSSRFAYEGYFYDMKEIQSKAKSLEHNLLRGQVPFSKSDLANLKIVQEIYKKSSNVVTRMQP